MDICRYYQQGNCRYGQYCRYEHVNSFGRNSKDSYNEDEVIAAVIAEEVQIAERGGQWLLSCFRPFSCGPCIPGMEDLSPEEVRWEMYQAEKKGMGQQAKLHFQQLCQDMKAKRDALKNPNRETIALLKKIAANSTKTLANKNAGKSSNFAFATPQLGNPSSTAASGNVFGNKGFVGQNNPFGGSFTATTNNNIFARSNTTTNPVFGGGATFGNNLGAFANTPIAGTVFGGAAPNAQPFGATAPQPTSVFSGTASQSVFGQPNVFGTAAPQTNNVFARPQTSQTATSVFDGGVSTSTSLFSNTMTSQSSNPLFGGTPNTTANPFGVAATQQQATNPVFGTPATTGNFNSGIFPQQKNVPAFGAAPVFAGASGFGGATNSIFGGQPAFPVVASSSNNIFGGQNTTTATFGSTAQQSANSFGAIAATSSAPNVFGAAQTTGPVISSPNASPFAAAVPTSNGPFVTTVSQFDTTTTTPSVFSNPAFGVPPRPAEPFGAAVATTTAAPFGPPTTGATFGNANTNNSPFGPTNFANVNNLFAATNTTITTTTANPFAPLGQQPTTPFGMLAPNQGSNTATVPASDPFGKPLYSTPVMSTMIDDTIYTPEGQLTDDEKSIYLAEKFMFGKIPLKPPTKDIR